MNYLGNMCCSRHYDAAVETLSSNKWGDKEDSDMPKDSFVSSDYKLTRDLTDKLSPRTRANFEIASKIFALFSTNSYFAGKFLKNRMNGVKVDEFTKMPLTEFEDMIDDFTGYSCVDLSFQGAYFARNPIVASVSFLTGALTGLALSPVAFFAGLIGEGKRDLRKEKAK